MPTVMRRHVRCPAAHARRRSDPRSVARDRVGRASHRRARRVGSDRAPSPCPSGYAVSMGRREPRGAGRGQRWRRRASSRRRRVPAARPAIRRRPPGSARELLARDARRVVRRDDPPLAVHEHCRRRHATQRRQDHRLEAATATSAADDAEHFALAVGTVDHHRIAERHDADVGARQVDVRSRDESALLAQRSEEPFHRVVVVAIGGAGLDVEDQRLERVARGPTAVGTARCHHSRCRRVPDRADSLITYPALSNVRWASSCSKIAGWKPVMSSDVNGPSPASPRRLHRLGHVAQRSRTRCRRRARRRPDRRRRRLRRR